MLKEDFEACLKAVNLNKKQFASLTGITERSVYGWDKTPTWVDSWLLNYAKYQEGEEIAITLIKTVGMLEQALREKSLTALLHEHWKKIPFYDGCVLLEERWQPDETVQIDFIYLKKQPSNQILHFVKLSKNVADFSAAGKNLRKILLHPKIPDAGEVYVDLILMHPYEVYEEQFIRKFFNDTIRGVELQIIKSESLLAYQNSYREKSIKSGNIANQIYHLVEQLVDK